MSFGSDSIQSLLYNDSPISTLVGDRIYNELVIPQAVTTMPIINYYIVSPVQGGSEIEEYTWSINCRDETQSGAETLAGLVFELLNRNSHSISGKDYFYRCNQLPVLAPVDREDVFNVPVEIYLRGRG